MARKHSGDGNYLVGERVVTDMAAAFEASEDEVLEERLHAGPGGRQGGGGERGGQPSSGLTAYGRDRMPAPTFGWTSTTARPGPGTTR